MVLDALRKVAPAIALVLKQWHGMYTHECSLQPLLDCLSDISVVIRSELVGKNAWQPKAPRPVLPRHRARAAGNAKARNVSSYAVFPGF
jgi:hypothetical protein